MMEKQVLLICGNKTESFVAQNFLDLSLRHDLTP
jgi:hypothetical protein